MTADEHARARAELSPLARATLDVVATCFLVHGFTPGLTAIAHAMGVDVAEMENVFRELVERGLLEKKNPNPNPKAPM